MARKTGLKYQINLQPQYTVPGRDSHNNLKNAMALFRQFASLLMSHPYLFLFGVK